jgi:hypothetical protein
MANKPKRDYSKRTKRSDEDLRKASLALAYEVEVLSFATNTLVKLADERHWIQNPLLEAFLVHTRNILDFLYPGTNLRDDDIIANDFFNKWDDWDTKAFAHLEQNPYLRTYLQPQRGTRMSGRWRINKQLSHLTYSRLGISEEEKWWDWPNIAVEIFRVLEIFEREAPREHLHAEFTQRLKWAWDIARGSKDPPEPL